MTKRFAEIDSEDINRGPDLTNFQLAFWQLAVERFNKIAAKYETDAVDDSTDEEPDVDDPYQKNEFLIDAAVAIVLAGTSVTQLLGQNVPANPDGRTPQPGPAYRQFFGTDPPADVTRLIRIYEDLRHFGPAKHQAVASISEADLCRYLDTAQDIWKAVLARWRQPISAIFKNTFKYPQ